MIFLISSFIALAIVFVAGLVVLGGLKTRGRMQRALNMTLFLVKVPREEPNTQSGAGQKPDKELIGIAEQLISSFSNFHSGGWNKFLYGEPYVVLEIAVHHIGEETYFYLAAPKKSEDVIEKQIYSFYPTAEVVKANDYNIFNPHGASAGTYLVYSKSSILPVKTYQKLETDPISGILTSMSKLEAEGEGVAMQILLRPSHASKIKSLGTKVARGMQAGESFKEALGKAQDSQRPGFIKELAKIGAGQKEEQETKPEKPKVVTPADEEVIKGIVSKTGKQNFDANIRLIASAVSQPRAEQILQDIQGGLAQFSAPDLNSFKAIKLAGSSLQKLFYNFSFRLFDERQKITMSAEEVVSLYHFPIASTAAPKVKFLKSKPAEPPASLPQEGIIIGKNIFRGQETLVRMTDEDRRRHMYVIGQTGTGKTTIMKAMVRQDIENGKGVCVIDPHGDFAEFTLSIVPKERIEDVIYFDPGDIARPMALNMLEIDPSHPEQKTMVIDELFGIFDKLYDLKTTGGPMFEKYFKNSALLLLDDYTNEIPVLADISRVLVDDEFRAGKLSRETNPLVKEFWEKEAEKAAGESSLANMAPYISSKITSFIFNEFLRPIINQPKSSFNFREAMDKKKILVINLSKGRIGEINASLLGLIIVGKLLMAALSRVDTDENLRSDFYLYMDEFQNFTTPSIATILSEARKYRLDLVLAHQFIKQLKEEIRDAVFGNVGSMAVFRISPDDAEFMKNKFEPVFSSQDLMNIDNLNAYVNLLINGQTSRPFNIEIEKEKVFGAGSAETAKAIKEISRLKYGRPREEVESDIRKKYETNS